MFVSFITCCTGQRSLLSLITLVCVCVLCVRVLCVCVVCVCVLCVCCVCVVCVLCVCVVCVLCVCVCAFISSVFSRTFLSRHVHSATSCSRCKHSSSHLALSSAISFSPYTCSSRLTLLCSISSSRFYRTSISLCSISFSVISPARNDRPERTHGHHTPHDL